MANSEELWMKDFAEASRLADDISKMLSEQGCLPSSDPLTKIHLSLIRRRITILRARLFNLEIQADHARILKKSISDSIMQEEGDVTKSERERETDSINVRNWRAAERPKDLSGASNRGVNEVKTSRIWRDRERGLAVVLDDNERIINVTKQISMEQDEVLYDKQRIISVQRQTVEQN